MSIWAALSERFFEELEVDGFGEDGDGAGIFWMLSGRPGGNEDDAGAGMFGDDVSSGGGTDGWRFVGSAAIESLDL